jgi:hypothetical protein
MDVVFTRGEAGRSLSGTFVAEYCGEGHQASLGVRVAWFSSPITGKVFAAYGCGKLYAAVDVNHLLKISSESSRRLAARADTVGVAKNRHGCTEW